MSRDQPPPPPARDLAPIVYDELRRLAAAYMRRERPGQTLQDMVVLIEELDPGNWGQGMSATRLRMARKTSAR